METIWKGNAYRVRAKKERSGKMTYRVERRHEGVWRLELIRGNRMVALQAAQGLDNADQ